jgi:hypothetical protein
MEEMSEFTAAEWSDDDILKFTFEAGGANRTLQLTRHNTCVYRHEADSESEYDYLVYANGEEENGYSVYFLEYNEKLNRFLDELDYPTHSLYSAKPGVIACKQKQDINAIHARLIREGQPEIDAAVRKLKTADYISDLFGDYTSE